MPNQPLALVFIAQAAIDLFCGGGSIPFEAARIGCEAFGADLNPVAGLLTWASLNLLGGSAAVQDEVQRVQEAVFAATDQQITDWGIEHNDRGERAEAFLYCVEVKPEGCDYYIPLAPSWVVAQKYNMVTRWTRVGDADRLTRKCWSCLTQISSGTKTRTAPPWWTGGCAMTMPEATLLACSARYSKLCTNQRSKP